MKKAVHKEIQTPTIVINSNQLHYQHCNLGIMDKNAAKTYVALNIINYLGWGLTEM